MKYRVEHRTTYAYSDAVSLCHNLLHLKPRKTPAQECLESEIVISPLPAVVSERHDYFGNRVVYFSIQTRHQTLEISAVSDVEVTTLPTPAISPAWEDVRDLLLNNPSANLDAYQFRRESQHIKFDPLLTEYAAESFTPRRPLLDATLELTQRIHKDFKYDSRVTCISTAATEVFKLRKGVCQDFAHLQISMLRSLGLAARYHSGYLRTQPAPGQEKMIGADASHAWLSVFCPEFGWIGMDPTNNMIPMDKHITVSWGRDYADVSPVMGVVLGGGHHSLTVAVQVTPF